MLSQEAGDSEINIEKQSQTPIAIFPIQNWKRYISNIDGAYLLCVESNTNGSFLQTYINVVEQLLKFSHFEGSMIP